MSRAVDFWVDSILEGYITEFVVDTITSYNKAEVIFFPRTMRKILYIFENLDKDACMRKRNPRNGV